MIFEILKPSNVEKAPTSNSINLFIDSESMELKGKTHNNEILTFKKEIEFSTNEENQNHYFEKQIMDNIFHKSRIQGELFEIISENQIYGSLNGNLYSHLPSTDDSSETKIFRHMLITSIDFYNVTRNDETDKDFCKIFGLYDLINPGASSPNEFIYKNKNYSLSAQKTTLDDEEAYHIVLKDKNGETIGTTVEVFASVCGNNVWKFIAKAGTDLYIDETCDIVGGEEMAPLVTGKQVLLPIARYSSGTSATNDSLSLASLPFDIFRRRRICRFK